jgi:hypothetical protein
MSPTPFGRKGAGQARLLNCRDGASPGSPQKLRMGRRGWKARGRPISMARRSGLRGRTRAQRRRARTRDPVRGASLPPVLYARRMGGRIAPQLAPLSCLCPDGFVQGRPPVSKAYGIHYPTAIHRPEPVRAAALRCKRHHALKAYLRGSFAPPLSQIEALARTGSSVVGASRPTPPALRSPIEERAQRVGLDNAGRAPSAMLRREQSA